MRRQFFIGFALIVALLAMLVPAMAGATGNGNNSTPVNGAAFTTTNTSVDGTGHCQNGNEDVNCNIYDGKQFVWLTGGPSEAALSDGTYFFAVVVPGGQGNNADSNPNDGTDKNLSDTTAAPYADGSLNADGSSIPSGDAYTNRTFSISGGVITYQGSHEFKNNKIRLMPYDDTTNNGGEYILAICNLADADPANGAPGINSSDCKYDSFKIKEAEVQFGLAPYVTKDAAGSYTNTFTWTIKKEAEQAEIKQSSANATINYTVMVSHKDGAISGVTVAGAVQVFNPNVVSDSDKTTVLVSGVNIKDQLSNGTVCLNVTNQTLAQFETDFAYQCSLDSVPDALDNTVTITWPDQSLSSGKLLKAGSNDFTFHNITFAETKVDNCVSVSDPADPSSPRTFCAGDAGETNNSFSFTYSRDVTGTPGTCTDFDNTATLTTNTTGSTASASQTVKVCVGADLTVSKTATPAFKRTYAWGITKDVDKTLVEQLGGTATFNYTIKVTHDSGTDSDWVVNGTITVVNPNDWEAISANLADAVDSGGVCVVSPSSVTVPKSGSATASYKCTYASAPSPTNGTNTATATWDNASVFTPSGAASGSAPVSFSTTAPTIVDGSATASDPNAPSPPLPATVAYTDPSPKTFTYSKTVTVPTNNLCTTIPNTATFVTNTTGTTGSASQTVKVCGAVTGGLTMGFWQNKNGQSIITGGAAVSGICKSGTWLRAYAPFQDLSATATCTQVGTYVTSVIKAANASGAAMNAMLKAQMLATALDVYFSDAALGGNKINAPTALGGVKVDLTQICHMIDNATTGAASCGSRYDASAAFGGAPSMTISGMLTYAANQSNAGGSAWYGQVKATQEKAKDAFDSINNQVAFVAP